MNCTIEPKRKYNILSKQLICCVKYCINWINIRHLNIVYVWMVKNIQIKTNNLEWFIIWSSSAEKSYTHQDKFWAELETGHRSHSVHIMQVWWHQIYAQTPARRKLQCKQSKHIYATQQQANESKRTPCKAPTPKRRSLSGSEQFASADSALLKHTLTIKSFGSVVAASNNDRSVIHRTHIIIKSWITHSNWGK